MLVKHPIESRTSGSNLGHAAFVLGTHANVRRPRSMEGVSMIEVLITLVIVAIGVLGVIAIQALSKKNNVDSISQTMAAQYSLDILERMRGNNSREALATYYNNAPNRVATPDAEPSPNCRDASCTPVTLALHDLWEWDQQLNGARETIGGAATGGLVSPTACIDGPAGGDSGIYTVTIAWRATTELPGDATVACGAGSGLYGTNNEFRRTMSIQAFITLPLD